MTALVVYLQNTIYRLKERQEGQTMAEYALILGGIAIVVILAIVFLGGRINDLFRATGSSVTTPFSSHPACGGGPAGLSRPRPAPATRSAEKKT
jgi:Flp pilus assembly pilin Flp